MNNDPFRTPIVRRESFDTGDSYMPSPSISIGQDALELLQTQLDNFPVLRSYCRTTLPVPSVLLLPQTISQLDLELSRNSDLMFECFSYLDIMSLVSLTYTGNSSSLMNFVIKSIQETRTVTSMDVTIASDELSNFIYKSGKDVHDLLINNKVLIAIYLYSLIDKMFYTE